MIQASVWDKDLRRKLQALTGPAKQRVYRRAFNRVGKPVAQRLQAAWKGAKHRRGSTTAKIAAAQEVKIRIFQRTSKTRGDAWMAIGTEYKRGGKAKVWHILERGFRHYRKLAAYASKPSLYGAQAGLRDHMAAAMKSAPKGKSRQAIQARRRYKAAAAREWAAANGAAAAEIATMKQKRRNAIQRAKSGATRIKGWLVSDAVARSTAGRLPTELAKELLRALQLELKGRAAA